MKPASARDVKAGRAGPKRDEIVVFWLIRDSACAECGCELGKGRFLRMEGERPLCLGCADLDHLVFLPRGNTALTRRATKYSIRTAIVVRFSRSRKRYERQGVLVEEQGLERAEQECLADAEAREVARGRAAERRQRLDQEYVRRFAGRVGDLFPGCPPSGQRAIAEHACLKHSGRVGRSAAATQFERDARRNPRPLGRGQGELCQEDDSLPWRIPAARCGVLQSDAIELAVRAHIRHQYTRYDELLVRGASRGEARGQQRGGHRPPLLLTGWPGSRPGDNQKLFCLED